MKGTRYLAAGLLALAWPAAARAQELEPRAYSSSPVGTNFAAIVAGRTQGSILFDPSIPITDVEAEIDLVTAGYGRTFALGGRQALVTVALPYAWGTIEGNVMEVAREVRRSGFADARVRASVNLVGPKAMTWPEFRAAKPATVFGMSMTVQVPTGEYDGTKLINLGTNRFAVKPEVGVSVPVGSWYLDAYAGVWFFEKNDAFFPGTASREQDPLFAGQLHASYTFKNRAWLALNGTWYGGGESTVDSGPPSTRQSNTRVGATFSFPIHAGQSIKVVASTGTSTRTGSDFDSFLAGWQLTWFDEATKRGPQP
jgi:hypothetical protein